MPHGLMILSLVRTIQNLTSSAVDHLASPASVSPKLSLGLLVLNICRINVFDCSYLTNVLIERYLKNLYQLLTNYMSEIYNAFYPILGIEYFILIICIVFKEVSIVRRGGVHNKGEITLMDIIGEIKKNPDFYKTGAIACFIGIVRGETENGVPVEKLELEAYEEKANETLTNICEEIKKREGIIDVHIHHNIGEFKVGEELVYVIVAGGHRKELFSALIDAVEGYKKRAQIWKAA